jgi:hypothetical protein
MVNRDPLDLGLAHEESTRTRSQEAQEVQEQDAVSDLRKRGSPEFSGSQDRDRPERQEALVRGRRFLVGQSLSGDGGRVRRCPNQRADVNSLRLAG